MPILSGLIVSVDAFFIGLSLGLQKKCRFFYLVLINIFLFALCVLGYLLAGQIYELITFDPDLIVGFAFIALGLWTILQFVRRKNSDDEANAPKKTIVLVGLVMSGEAMLITMGITFIFISQASVAIPLTVALAHFGYSAFSFYLARTRHVKRIPAALSHTISGLALITYGLFALFVEFGMVY
ncbi:MAG: manganese efflux pump [Defluviitaleaceae bacterium]|nr:manganese efflux pump [Defluviitaleaceae bacterium]